MLDKQFVQKKVRDLMAWFKTKDQSFVEDHLCNLVSNKVKKQYQEISQLIISEFALMLAAVRQQNQNISFMSVFCMLYMIRTYSTAKCIQLLSILRSIMLRSINLLVKSLESLKFLLYVQNMKYLWRTICQFKPPL